MAQNWRSGPPTAEPTKSFWQSPPDVGLENYNAAIFPTYVDIVIIGSGLTGALIAYNLLKRPGPKPSILMLEARSAVSGATGRNGGHIKPDCCRGFAEYREYHGTKMAVKQCHFESANLVAMTEFIQEHNLVQEVDLVACQTVDVYMSEGSWQHQLKSFSDFKNAGGDVSKIQVYHGEEAQKISRVPACHGAITYPAASLWPYRLTVRILEMGISLGLKLQTNTTVMAIVRSESNDQWKVVIPTGEVRTQKVFHATNAYSSYLLPEFTGKIVPLKGHVAAITPSIIYEKSPLDKTMAFVWDMDFDYLIQRQAGEKHIIIGGRDLEHPAGLTGPLGDSDDSTLTEEIAQGLKDFPLKYFEGWSDIKKRGTRVCPETLVWTGIMGFSKDCLPFLGELPGKPAQYIAAGYHGHGMARIYLSVKGLCDSVWGETVDDRIPEAYFDLKSRLVGVIDLVKMGIVEE